MKDRRLGIRIPSKLFEEAKVVAHHQKMTLTDFVIRLLQEAIEADKRTRGVCPTVDAEQV